MDVPIRCICPPHEPWIGGDPRPVRHPDGDTVILPDVLDFRKTLTVRQHIAHGKGSEMTLAEMMALLGEAYLLYCIADWTLVDEKDKPLPVSKAAVSLLLMTVENMDVAETVGNAADSLYSDKVFLPLRSGASSSSPGTPTTGSTSRTPGSTPQPKRSKRSSTSTTPMAVTGPMAASPGGASNSSLS